MTAVLGAGISGLSAGFYILKRFGQPPTIYEGTSRLGGWIRTENRERYIFEVGPRTLRPKGVAGANTLEMIQELQLAVEPIRSNHVAARNRMIYAKGSLCLLPSSLISIFKKQPPFSRPLISALFNDLRAGRKTIKRGDESIYDFVNRRFGTEIADYAISAMICGICAGDAKEISVRFLMDELFEKEQEYGGVVKGIFMSKFRGAKKKEALSATNRTGIFQEPMSEFFQRSIREKWSMYRVEGGLENLPRTLGTHLKEQNVSIQTSAECQKITFKDDRVTMLIKGHEIDAEHIVSALPSYKIAPLVQDQHPSLSALLNTIPYVDVAVVNLQYSSDDLLKHHAFGFLVPPIERLPILGVIFDSCCFDMKGSTVLTVMMGGKWFEQNFGKNPTQKQLLDIALQYVERILAISIQPRLSRVNILQKCIPQYTVGHKQRVTSIRRYLQQYKMPLTLCGSAYDGVGINDAILSARMQVESMRN